VTLVRKARAAVLVAALLAVSACSGTAKAGSPSSSDTPGGSTSSSTAVTTAAPSSTAAPQPAALTFSPAADVSQVRADVPVVVSVSHGTLKSVTLSAASSGSLTGELDKAGTYWRNVDPLAPGRSYTLTVKAAGEDGVEVDKVQRFTTKGAASLVSSTLIPALDDLS